MFALLATLAGSLIASKSAKKQQETQNAYNEEAYLQQREDSIIDQKELLPRLRESAESAGFNPLAALQATGGSGFGQTGAVKAPKLASQSLLSGVLKGAADYAVSHYADQKAHKQALERIEKINSDRTLQTHKQRRVVNSTANAIKTKSLPSLGKTATAVKSVRSDEPQGQDGFTSYTTPEVGNRTITNPYPAWSGIRPNPHNPDAASYEERGGEALEFTGGIGTTVGDVVYSVKDNNRMARQENPQKRGVMPWTSNKAAMMYPSTGPTSRPKLQGKDYKPNRKDFMRQNYPTVYD